MDSRSLWNRYKTWLYDDPATGFRLDVSRMDLRDDDAEAMAPAFARAFSAMDALESGAIANPDENRMVGHYWLRAPGAGAEPRIAGDQGTLTRILAFADGVHHAASGPTRAADSRTS
jgi:glucose-6-phosphate isomerase